MANWYTSTDSDLSTLEDSTLGTYTDGLPDSYDLMQWYGSQDYPISTLTDSEMDDRIDGRAPLGPPWHIKTVTPSDNTQKSKGEWNIKTVYGEKN